MFAGPRRMRPSTPLLEIPSTENSHLSYLDGPGCSQIASLIDPIEMPSLAA
jgi:hypothetical protein